MNTIQRLAMRAIIRAVAMVPACWPNEEVERAAELLAAALGILGATPEDMAELNRIAMALLRRMFPEQALDQAQAELEAEGVEDKEWN